MCGTIILTTLKVILTDSYLNEGYQEGTPNQWLARVINIGLQQTASSSIATAIGTIGDLLLIDLSLLHPENANSVTAEDPPTMLE